MEMKKLFLSISILLALVLALNLVSADRIVNYSVYQSIIETNSSLTTSLIPVNGVNAIVYNCTGINCSTIGSVITSLNSTNSSNVLSVHFPENLSSTYGYVIYVSKLEYIGWEQRNVIRYGNGTNVSSESFYLSKKRTGFAPINNLSVVNEQAIYMPLQINVTTGIDASTYSALQNASRYGFGLIEPAVNTTVLLTITNSSGFIVNQSTKNILIPISGSSLVSWDYNFTRVGSYNISVSTNVTDVRILNSVVQTALVSTNIIQNNLTNYTYTLIQNIIASPLTPAINQTVNFSLNYLSNFVSGNGSLTAINTSLYLSLTRDSLLINNTYVLLPAGSNTTYSSYNFQNFFNSTGNYVLSVLGVPNSTLGNYTLPSLQTLSFVIGNVNSTITNNTNSTHTDDPNNHDDDDNTVEEDEQLFRVLNSSRMSAGQNSTVIDLSPKTSFNYMSLIWILLALLFLMLLAIFLILIFKYGLSN